VSPIYEYECPGCKAQTKEIRCVADRSEGPTCYRCGKQQMKQVILSPPVGMVKNPAVPRGSK